MRVMLTNYYTTTVLAGDAAATKQARPFQPQTGVSVLSPPFEFESSFKEKESEERERETLLGGCSLSYIQSSLLSFRL